MLRAFITFALALSLATCAGPQIGFADAYSPQAVVAPVSEAQLQQIGRAAQTAADPAEVAQSIAPIANPDGSWNFVPLMNGLMSFALAVLAAVGSAVAVWVGKTLKDRLGIDIDIKEAAKDIGMTTYAETAVKKALDYARQRTGLTDDKLQDVEIRNTYLALAASFVFKQYPEVWTWIAKGETGVMQWIEAHLSPDAALPTKTVEGVGVVAKA